MTKIINFEYFADYANHNIEFVESNPMLYYHLKNTIDMVYEGKIQQNNCFNISDDNCNVVVLLVKNQCLIYADNINDEVISKLSEGLEFHLFKEYVFYGTKQVIDALFKLHNAEFREIKHRIIYECKIVNPNFKCSSGHLRNSSHLDIHNLSRFHILFENEYSHKNPSIEEAFQFVDGSIKCRNLYQWNDSNNNICAITQVLDNEYDFPIIGHVFVNPNLRNEGYAASIVYEVTKGLLNAGYEKCMLATDALNPASNAAFRKVGYAPTGEYVVRHKLK